MKKRHMDIKMICFLVRYLCMKSVIVNSHPCSIKTCRKGEEGRKRVWMNVHLETEGLILAGSEDSRRLNNGYTHSQIEKVCSTVPQLCGGGSITRNYHMPVRKGNTRLQTEMKGHGNDLLCTYCLHMLKQHTTP